MKQMTGEDCESCINCGNCDSCVNDKYDNCNRTTYDNYDRTFLSRTQFDISFTLSPVTLTYNFVHLQSKTQLY